MSLRTNLFGNSVDIDLDTRLPGTPRYYDWRVHEEIIHCLQCHSLGLRKKEVKEHGVGDIADDKQNVVPPSD